MKLTPACLAVLAHAKTTTEICPSKYDGTPESGCYTQSAPWHPGKDVTCSMENAACMETTCSATGISAFFRANLFHTNSQNTETFMKQLHDGTRAIYIEGSSTPLVPNDVNCGYGTNSNGLYINWEYGNAACPLAPTMNANGKIEYSVKLVSPGNEPGFETIEFYVDTVVSASCQYDPEVDVKASFWINQEDVDMDITGEGKLTSMFECLFFADDKRKNQIKDHNIVNMGERIYGLVKARGAAGYGLKYKLRRVRFSDATGGTGSSIEVVGGPGNSGKGNSLMDAKVKKPYVLPFSKNQKFSFLSFGFENLGNQNHMDVTCRIKLLLDPDFAAANNGLTVRNSGLMGPDFIKDAPVAGWGESDYYEEY